MEVLFPFSVQDIISQWIRPSTTMSGNQAYVLSYFHVLKLHESGSVCDQIQPLVVGRVEVLRDDHIFDGILEGEASSIARRLCVDSES